MNNPYRRGRLIRDIRDGYLYRISGSITGISKPFFWCIDRTGNWAAISTKDMALLDERLHNFPAIRRLTKLDEHDFKPCRWGRAHSVFMGPSMRQFAEMICRTGERIRTRSPIPFRDHNPKSRHRLDGITVTKYRGNRHVVISLDDTAISVCGVMGRIGIMRGSIEQLKRNHTYTMWVLENG